jgi:hypothetical protein
MPSIGSERTVPTSIIKEGAPKRFQDATTRKVHVMPFWKLLDPIVGVYSNGGYACVPHGWQRDTFAMLPCRIRLAVFPVTFFLFVLSLSCCCSSCGEAGGLVGGEGCEIILM